jgi:hypothetical protein
MSKSPVKAIREFCLECCGGNSNDVKFCTAPRCPLYAFRFGKNPYIKREMTEEQKNAAKARLAEARNRRADHDTD